MAGNEFLTIPAPPAPSIHKQNSWSPDSFREESWLRRKENQRRKQNRSLTEDDLDELKACFELGFGFETSSPEIDQRLSDAIPALELYYAVNKQYNDVVSKSSASSASSVASECDSPPSVGCPNSIFGSGENPQKMKTRLRQWAQLVACSVRQSLR
uniref:Uncharacterized protein n=1 Tax=Kalanchoe fedtschenkoi TaxID=63787 RepID=A0A7N0TAH5_KALFE